MGNKIRHQAHTDEHSADNGEAGRSNRSMPTMTTKQKGDVAEAFVIAALIASGRNVLIPFGDRNRYDVVTEAAGKFERIQIKYGRIAQDFQLSAGNSGQAR